MVTIVEILEIVAADLDSRPINANTQLIAHAPNMAKSEATINHPNPASGRHPRMKPVPIEKKAAATYRKISDATKPASGAIRTMGNDLNRSKTPVSKSSRNCVPVADDDMTSV
ncbi:hypothetical protein D3C76_1045020 [compost metagenome]